MSADKKRRGLGETSKHVFDNIPTPDEVQAIRSEVPRFTTYRPLTARVTSQQKAWLAQVELEIQEQRQSQKKPRITKNSIIRAALERLMRDFDRLDLEDILDERDLIDRVLKL